MYDYTFSNSSAIKRILVDPHYLVISIQFTSSDDWYVYGINTFKGNPFADIVTGLKVIIDTKESIGKYINRVLRISDGVNITNDPLYEGGLYRYELEKYLSKELLSTAP